MVRKTADVWKKDVWDIHALSQMFRELRFFLGNEGNDGKNLSSQTWPGSPTRPPCRHPRPSNMGKRSKCPQGHEAKMLVQGHNLRLLDRALVALKRCDL